MDYTIFIRPLIGATIGYVTNWIAVKMMFRPLNPIKIGKFTLPFTPGIIPKNKARLAEAIGNTVSDELLSENDLKNYLLSDSMKSAIRKNIIDFLNKQAENDKTIREILISCIEEKNYTKFVKIINEKFSSSIYQTVLEANLGNIIAEQIEISAKEKIKGSMLGILGGNAIIATISQEASEKINLYVSNEGKNLIHEMVEKEINKYTSITVSNIIEEVGQSNIDLVSFILDLYEKFVIEKLSSLLKTINISEIVQNKINEMDTLELEKLILFIMKKELNALVNLGALIGLILGLINLLF